MNKIVEYRNNNMGKEKAIFSKIIFVSVFFLAVALISCNGGLSEKPDVKESDSIISEYVQIGFKLSVPEFEDRKAIPNSSSYSNMVYVLTGISDGGQEETLGTWGSLTQLRNASLTIHTGQWQLTLTSYLNTSSSYYDYEYGYSSSSIGYDSAKPILQDTIELILTQSSTLAFTLKEVENCKVNGSFEYTINYSESRSENWSLSAKLLNAEDLSETDYRVSYSTYSSYTVFSNSGIPSGNYLLQIQFIYKNGDTSFESYTMPLIQIAAGLKTTGSKTLSADELTRFYSITYSYLENGVMPENSVSTYTPYKAVVLENPTRTNYKFLGWYYSTDWTDENKLPINSQGKYILNQNHDQSGDVYIYARWLRMYYEQNGFSWSLSDDGVLTISGEGDVPFYAGSFSEWQNATSVIVEEGITGFAYNNYSDRTGFNSYSQYGANGRNIKSISLPSTLTSIPNSCFENCVSLETINIPENVTSIATEAFYGCNKLKSITLPAGLTYIGENAFYCCFSLESITIPSTVTTLYRNAFTGWSDTKVITLDWNSDDETERNIYNLNNYTAGTNAKYKDGKAVWFGWSLNDDGVLRIRGTGDFPFASLEEWKDATSAIIEEGITGFAEPDWSYGHYGFSNYYDGRDLGYTKNIESISLPSTFTWLCYNCFYGCSSLKEINIPENVTEIKDNAFYGCTALESLTLPEGLTYIGENAFGNCTAIESITIPASVTTLNRNAFSGWNDEQAITLDWNSNDDIERNIYYTDMYTTGTNAKYKDGKNAWFSWILNEEGVLRIRGNGEVPFYSASFSEWQNATSVIVEEGVMGFHYAENGWVGLSNIDHKYAQNIKSVQLPSTLTSISRCCFNGCTALEEIIIPNSVTSIGEYAFQGCVALESITIPNSVTSIGEGTFGGCSGLTAFTIPSSVTSIGDYAFEYCTGISSITVPVTVTNQFNRNVFKGWRSNQTITLDWNSNDSTHTMPYVDTWWNGYSYCQGNWGTHAKYRNGVYAWNGTTVNNDGTTIIVSGEGQHYAYNNSGMDLEKVTSIVVQEGITSLVCGDIVENNTTVKTVSLPSTLTTLGDSVFAGFAGIEQIEIPSTVTSIGGRAFNGCSSLSSVNIPDDITIIYDYTFNDCASLTQLTLPASLESIGNGVFNNSGLTSLSIPANVTSIEPCFKNCGALQSVNLGGCSIEIPEECFAGCNSLQTVTGTTGITSIGKNAFRECSSLSSISLPTTLTSIAEYAFYKCTGFTTLTIPSSVTEIGSSAFDYCTGSQTITLNWNASDLTERTIASDAFGYVGVVVKYEDGTNYGN